MSAKLYAWVAPVTLSSALLRRRRTASLVAADHTWVTDYDNRVVPYPDIGAVKAAGRALWFCWGSFYRSGGTPEIPSGFVTESGADIALARCLVTENSPCSTNQGAEGTVYKYGKDGVCHQLANQVLFAASRFSGRQMTVSGVKGYIFSVARYGTYGRREAEFRRKIGSCGASAVNSTPAKRLTMDAPSASHLPDEFADRIQAIIGARDPRLAERLLALRQRLQRDDDEAPENEDIEAVDDRGDRFLSAAQELLGDRLFAEVFGLEAGQVVRFSFPAD